MIIVYFIYFLILNLLIFYFLTRKIELAKKVKILIVGFLVIFGVIQFFLESTLSNEHFIHLMFCSLLLIVFHFGSGFAIKIMKKMNKNFENHPVFTGFNFMRFYVIYILVVLYQGISIFSSQAREHFTNVESYI